MATWWKIPLQPSQPQTLTTALSDANYGFSLKWFEAAKVWLLDISDVNGVPLVLGIPLTTGSDLLLQYKHLGFVGGLWCSTEGDPDAPPTFQTLGSSSFLYYVEE